MPTTGSASVDRASARDSSYDPGPLATDVSPAFTHTAIRKAARRAADWQLAKAEGDFDRQWTFAALYDGTLAASKTTGNERSYLNLLNSRFLHAEDIAASEVDAMVKR